MYPNPAHNFIKIENVENIKYQSVGIYNYLGKLVVELNDTKETIDISGLNNRICFVKIYHSNGIIETIKFLKN
ncbi:MAG: T9SS type A sorting domain-containing protein [Bacteroidia bacterium]